MAGHRRAATAASFLAVVLLAGCTAGGDPPSSSSASSSTATADSAEVTTVAAALDVPWSLAFHDGTPLVSERDSGEILELDDSGDSRVVGAVQSAQARGEGACWASQSGTASSTRT